MGDRLSDHQEQYRYHLVLSATITSLSDKQSNFIGNYLRRYQQLMTVNSDWILTEKP
jgi:hypothetical protein